MNKLVKKIDGVTFSSNRRGFINAVSRKESGSDLRYSFDYKGKNKEGKPVNNPKAVQILNHWKYMGLFQFSEEALIDVGCYKFDGTKNGTYQDWIGAWTGLFGATSFNTFRHSGDIQMKAIQKWINILCGYAKNTNLNEFYGKTIRGFEVTESGVIAAIHLKGMTEVRRFLTSDGKTNTGDGNGTRVSDYMEKFAHYDLESCCQRKIYVKLIDASGDPVVGKEVKIKSNYIGKYNVGELSVAHKTDEHGNLPVIVRHPKAEIQLEIDGKKVEKIEQSANKIQKYELPYIDGVKHITTLEKNSELPPSTVSDNELSQIPPPEPSAPQEGEVRSNSGIEYGISIVDADSKKTVTHMRFFLLHNNKLSELRTDANGIKSGLQAASGDTVEILVKGVERNQSILTFTVDDSTGIKEVPLPVVKTTIKLSMRRKGQLVPIVGYQCKAFYRDKEYLKTTNRNGEFTLKTLAAFPVKLMTLQGMRIGQIRTDQYKISRHTRIYDKTFRVITYNSLGQRSPSSFLLSGLGKNITLMTDGTSEKMCHGPLGATVLVRTDVGSVKVGITNNLNEIHIRKGHKDLLKINNIVSIQKQLPKVETPAKQKASTARNTPEEKASEPEYKTPDNSVKDTMTNNGHKPLSVLSSNTPPANDTTVYHIYHHGKIKRQNSQATGFAHFIYYDEKGNQHDLGKSAYIPARRLKKGNIPIGGKIYLIDQRKHSSYKKGDIGYNWKIISRSKRYYLSGHSLAAIFGAMCSLRYNKYVGSGFSNRKGESVAPSVSHINGINGDFRYLGKNQAHVSGPMHTTNKLFDWNANVKFVKALYKFGYKDFLSKPVTYYGNKMLPHTRPQKNHHHHIHLQGFRPDIEDI